MNKKTNKLKFCSVRDCKNHENANSTYHLFPKNDKLKKLWLLKLKRNFQLTHMKVCSSHFTPDDFIPTHQYAFKKYLKATAVPSLNLPIRSTGLKVNEKQSQERLQRANRRENNKNENKILKTEKTKIYFDEVNSNNIENNYSTHNLENSNDTFNDNALPIELPLAQSAPVQNNVSILDAQVQSTSVETESVTKIDVQVQVDSCEARFSVTKLLISDDLLNAYTGIHSLKLLEAIEKCLIKLKSERKHISQPLLLSAKECIILACIKMKLNLSYVCLSVLFTVSPNTCKNYFIKTVNDLRIIFTPTIRWPDKDEILKNIPKSFENFSSTVVILDCTEVRIERTKCLKCKIHTFSHYKGCNTAKFLIGVTPSGLCSYVNPAYSGGASDKQIFNESNIFNKTIPDVDSIMVDKGFLIEEECAINRIKLVRPPFLKRKKLTATEAEDTSNIARARIQVERVIQRIKQFTILHGPVPYNLVKVLDAIIVTICGLVNLSAPILAKDKYL